MKITTKGLRPMKKIPLALAVSALSVGSANAVEFNFGDLGVQLDNTISYGVAWRVEGRDSDQIMPGNGTLVGETGTGSSYNYDDGTLNYSKGDIYTNAVKWSGDLEINYQNFGGFFRARAYYDTALMDEDTDFKQLNDATKDAAGKGAELMDAYVWADMIWDQLRLTCVSVVRWSAGVRVLLFRVVLTVLTQWMLLHSVSQVLK